MITISHEGGAVSSCGQFDELPNHTGQNGFWALALFSRCHCGTGSRIGGNYKRSKVISAVQFVKPEFSIKLSCVMSLNLLN